MQQQVTKRGIPWATLPVLLAVIFIVEVVSAADGPGLGNLSYNPVEVFTPVGQVVSPRGHGSVAMVNGYLMVIYSSDGGGTAEDGGIEFWDISNPRDPQLHVRWENENTFGLREPHGFGFANPDGRDLMVAQAVDGIQFWDFTDPDAIALLDYLDLPGIEAGNYSGAWWVFWQAPYVYVAGVGEGIYIVDASDPAAPVLANRIPTSEIGGLNPGLIYAIGNLLVVMRHQDSGYATFDISDPVNPKLLFNTPGGNKGYSHLFAAGKILTSGGNGDVVTMHVHEVSIDGASINFLGSGPSVCTEPVAMGLANGGYGSYQDGYFLSGFSNNFAKFDVTTFDLVGCGTSNIVDRDEDFAVVLGNVVWVGNDHGQGSALIPHQAAPDLIGPEVHWVHPPDAATGLQLTSRVGVSMSDNIDISSVDETTFTVRPSGGVAIAGRYSVQFGIINFSPDQPLQPGTQYEVVISGVKDIVGNAGGTFASTFSTERNDPASCTLDSPGPVEIGETAGLSPSATFGTPPISYSWNFGDGSVPTPPSLSPPANHVYTTPARFGVTLTVNNEFGASECSAVQIVYHPVTADAPSGSSPIAVDEWRSYNVNPDNGTVSAIDGVSLTKLWEAPAGQAPQTLAIAPNGNIWVSSRDDAAIHILQAGSGALVKRIPLRQNSQPFGVVFAPNGSRAYVTLQATGQMVILDQSGVVVDTIGAGPRPRGIAVSSDSKRIFITRFVSASTELTDPDNPVTLQLPYGEVREIDAAALEITHIYPLRFDDSPDTEFGGRGVPNYVNAIRISPDGRHALIASKKDNVARGLFLDGLPLTFESRVRTIVSQLDLVANSENIDARIDLNDRDMAQSIIFSPLGDIFFVGLQGNDLVEVRDSNGLNILASFPVGRAPQGFAIDPVGRRLYVHEYMSRTVSIFDISELLDATSNTVSLLAQVPVVTNESLVPEVLLGKQIFYNSSDPRMSRDGYLSCASCHLDGGSDGQVWDFTQVGEGLRNTIELIGRGAIGHGHLHWTANFDEIQDFENDIRGQFGGDGFMTDANFAATREPLGAAKAGLSQDLDALAAYVTSLDHFPHSPFRAPDGSLTSDGQNGRCQFVRGCSECHAGPSFTDGLRHDVGTVQANSGKGHGETLEGVGIETPTLKGVWATPPYLHNGGAADLAGVLDNAAHVGSLTASEKSDLLAYLLQIDNHEDDDTQCFGEFADEESDFVDDESDGSLANAAGGSAIGLVALTGLFLVGAIRRASRYPRRSGYSGRRSGCLAGCEEKQRNCFQ